MQTYINNRKRENLSHLILWGVLNCELNLFNCYRTIQNFLWLLVSVLVNYFIYISNYFHKVAHTTLSFPLKNDLAVPGLGCSTCDLVSWPAIELRHPALGAQSFNQRILREASYLFNVCYICGYVLFFIPDIGICVSFFNPLLPGVYPLHSLQSTNFWLDWFSLTFAFLPPISAFIFISSHFWV